MEKLDYREIVKNFILKYAQEECANDLENVEIVFDTERYTYLLIVAGWKNEERIYWFPIHIRIKEGKIWIQRDFTEEGIANQLVELGVPKTDIVLGFRSPYVRQFTGFASV
jgi:hypothetical protein